MCKLGVFVKGLQQDMWRMSGSRDWLSNACASVERSIEVRVNHVAESYGFTFTIQDRCDNFGALRTSDINENRISVWELNFPGWYSEHTQVILLPIPMIGYFRLEHVLRVPSFLDPIHGIALACMAYLVLPEVCADPDDVRSSQRSVVLGMVIHDLIQQACDATLFCGYWDFSHARATQIRARM